MAMAVSTEMDRTRLTLMSFVRRWAPYVKVWESPLESKLVVVCTLCRTQHVIMGAMFAQSVSDVFDLIANMLRVHGSAAASDTPHWFREQLVIARGRVGAMGPDATDQQAEG